MITLPEGVWRLCGIFGCVLHEGSHAAPIIHSALKRLEYRGYDSVGEVTIDDDRLTVKKDSGRLEEVHARYNLDDLPGPVGVGHTRWATHGRPVYENSHPLRSEEHTSELQSHVNLVCRLLLEKKKALFTPRAPTP